MKTKLGLAVIAGLALTLAGCSKKIEKTEDVRPVRIVTLNSESGNQEFELAGEVRPKIESRLGFRVPGKIIARKVDSGSVVKRGQVLMTLDPQDLSLARAQAQAALTAAESQRDLAKAELARYQELRSKNFVAQAVLDAKEASYKSALSVYQQAQSGLNNQTNQVAYTQLVADADGIVTGIDAEIGQVVGAGTPVVRLAQGREIDIVVSVPEDKINQIKAMNKVLIRINAIGDKIFNASLRELTPLADSVTRTFSAKYALMGDTQDVRLGMTATVKLQESTTKTVFRLPLTALHAEKGKAAVWIYENGSVKLQPVKIGNMSADFVTIEEGVKSGQKIVTAGVNLLKEGQKVTVLGEQPKSAANSSSSAAGVKQ